MKKMLVLLVVLLMVGCEAKETVTPKEVKEIIKQEQQVEQSKEEVKEQPKEEVKEEPKKVEIKEKPQRVEKELPKKEEPKKKEQDNNIDPETGLAEVKDGTHLEEEAKKQEEEYGVWTKDYCPECGQPIDDCICDGDTDDSIDYNNTPIYNDYRDPDEFNEEDDEIWIREYGNTDEVDDYSEENEYN